VRDQYRVQIERETPDKKKRRDERDGKQPGIFGHWVVIGTLI
jgi:hypothetical protein